MGANNSQRQKVSSSPGPQGAYTPPRKGEIAGGTETKGANLSPSHFLLQPCPQGQVALGRPLLTHPALKPFSPSLLTAEKPHVVFLTQTSSHVTSVQVLQEAHTKMELGGQGISWRR